ncbi:hypothetical protein LJR296_007989 [Cupriavidus necator]|uniref:hypothetical protein n=1 Tax=Cupriavidus necator TaxID=106590 RepID=UPI003ECD5804
MKKAMFVVKRRQSPMLAAIVEYSEVSGRRGKVLVSEPIANDFTNEMLIAAARRLVPQVTGYQVILPIGVDL